MPTVNEVFATGSHVSKADVRTLLNDQFGRVDDLLAADVVGDGVADDTVELVRLAGLGAINLPKGKRALTSWTELPAGVDLMGHGAVILTTPLRAISGARIEGRKLVVPTGFDWTPLILPIYRNGRWQGHRRVRDVIGTFVGTTYYVDGALGDDGNAGNAAAPLKYIETALQKADVAEVLVAPGWYDRDAGWSAAVMSTTADGVVVRPWPKRPGAIISATSWTPARSDWTRSASPNQHCFESAAGLADNVLNVVDMSMTETHFIDGQFITMPKVYTQVGSDTLCFATPHSFYVTTGRLVINPNAASVPEGMPGAYNQATIDGLFSPADSIKFLINGANGTWQVNKHLYCEGISFVGGDAPFKIEHTAAGRTKTIGFSGCQFLLGSETQYGQGLRIDGGSMQILLEDCVVVLNRRDGFNGHDHPTAGAPDVTEINCMCVLNGTDGAGTNNGSSMHGACGSLRIGGLYGLCEGPSVADIETGCSWVVGSRILQARRIAAGVTVSSFYCSQRKIWAYDVSVEASGDNALACSDGGGLTPGQFYLHNVGFNGAAEENGGFFDAYQQT